MKKICLIGLVATTLSTSCFTSVTALAAPNTNSQQVHTQGLAEVHTLSNSIRMLGIQAPLIQAYGLVILQQPDARVEAMSSLTNHQAFAKTNVREWLDEYKPQILAMNQEMIRCNNRFNGYYNKLLDLLGSLNNNEQAKKDFITAVDQMQQQAQAVYEHLEQTSSSLNRFKVQLVTDSKSLSEKSNIAIQSLQGTNGNIEQLRAEVKRLQEEIQNNLITILNRPDEIIKGSINIGKELFKITSTTAESKTIDFTSICSLSEEFMKATDSKTQQATLNLQQKQKELLTVIQKLSQTQVQATEITFIEDQVNSFAALISRQVATFDTVIGDWKLFEEGLTQLKANSQVQGNVNTTDVQKQLTQLKEWNDTLNKQTKQFEDSMLQVTVQ